MWLVRADRFRVTLLIYSVDVCICACRGFVVAFNQVSCSINICSGSSPMNAKCNLEMDHLLGVNGKKKLHSIEWCLSLPMMVLRMHWKSDLLSKQRMGGGGGGQQLRTRNWIKVCIKRLQCVQPFLQATTWWTATLQCLIGHGVFLCDGAVLQWRLMKGWGAGTGLVLISLTAVSHDQESNSGH